MNKLQLFRLLRRHVKLSEKRSVVYEQNKVAKTIIYVMGAFAMVYMLFISVMLALIAHDTESYTPSELSVSSFQASHPPIILYGLQLLFHTL